jgi:hypothetical protein
MISAKNCTNPESFSGFGRGRRIDWRNPMDLPYNCVGKSYLINRDNDYIVTINIISIVDKYCHLCSHGQKKN